MTILLNVCAHFHSYIAHAYTNTCCESKNAFVTTATPPLPTLQAVDTRDTVAESGVMIDVRMVIMS